MAEENEGSLKVVKVNIDENPELASVYGIRSIPAFKVFNKGDVELQFGGALPKSQFEAALAPFLDLLPENSHRRLLAMSVDRSKRPYQMDS
ncbi:thioredoxin family protein [Enterobacter hormaechei]